MTPADIRILIIDDENLVRENLVAYCEDEGFPVAATTNGEDALELLKTAHFDIGIIDMRLPGIDGNSVILQAHGINPGMKFLIHTGSTNYSLPKELVDLGLKPAHVLRKPIGDMDLLRDRIIELVND
ncbi:MAG: response regulator [Spirochaetes bacterium]|nr:response regulator [Spirochaetota bacterium]